MVERLVDVLRGDKVLHTYPITVEDSAHVQDDAVYEKKAMEAAAYDQLVPDAELKHLNTRMHLSRGGSLAQAGDDKGTLSQTKESLDELVRQRAYFLWQADGKPEGRREHHWARALDQHLQERAYFLWQQQGCPEGRAEENWQRTCEFEKY